MRTPRFTFVSDGKPRRRLLVGSSKGPFLRISVWHAGLLSPPASPGILQYSDRDPVIQRLFHLCGPGVAFPTFASFRLPFAWLGGRTHIAAVINVRFADL
jgi:hypothetical protein